MAGSRNPELQRVLAALNSFSQQPQQDQQHSSYAPLRENRYENPITPHANSSSLHSLTNLPGLGLLPPANAYDRPITPPSISRNQSHAPNQFQHQNRMPSQPPPTAPLRSKTSTPKYDTPDASNITTWPAALKHITRYLASNEKVAARVKHLINEQHKHEREWWAGREAIVDRQQGRSGTSEQVSTILKSLGANVPAASKVSSLPDAEQKKANEAELKAYDEKVYKALCAMVADFDRQLREMGVPFYAIKHELVILKDGPEKTPGEHQGKLDKGELRELQKKVCETLEDLFGDEE
ncbi:hypothetical protein H2200_009000 [Cladophialophora chaetospira]|uniref:Uncharacterized protein n=1 Tax=Cladophialophora chaetospira TaxID=386627 RepID=A0AA38X530_9EURO|nr:hypothetical protein H2200_009000 [Cladophialophora chaetospira]